MTGVSIRSPLKTEIQGESHVKMEAKTGVMLLQAKKYLGLPEAGRGKDSPEAFAGSLALLIF